MRKAFGLIRKPYYYNNLKWWMMDLKWSNYCYKSSGDSKGIIENQNFWFHLLSKLLYIFSKIVFWNFLVILTTCLVFRVWGNIKILFILMTIQRGWDPIYHYLNSTILCLSSRSKSGYFIGHPRPLHLFGKVSSKYCRTDKAKWQETKPILLSQF